MQVVELSLGAEIKMAAICYLNSSLLYSSQTREHFWGRKKLSLIIAGHKESYAGDDAPLQQSVFSMKQQLQSN